MNQPINKPWITLALVAIATFPVVASAQPDTLEEINVVEKAPKETDKAILKVGAVSARDDIATSTQTLDTIIRSMPGTFTQIDKSQGTVSVNLRGATGFGRANTQIDGVSQTFFSTSTDGSGRAGGTAQFGALVDPSFLVSAEGEKGTFNGSSGSNALMGSVNFRTIGVKDLIAEGHYAGLMLSGLWGTNANGPNRSVIVGLKHNMENERYVGVLYGYSERHLSQDFRIGGGARVTDSSIDLGIAKDHYDEVNTDTAPYDVAHNEQTPRGRLVKLEYGDRWNQAVFTWRDYNTGVGGRLVKAQSHQLNWTLQFPDTPLPTLAFLYNRSSNGQFYERGVNFMDKILREDLKLHNNSSVFDVSALFSKEWGELAKWDVKLGYNVLHNTYTKNRHPSEFNINLDNDETNEDPNCIGLRCITKKYTATIFQPDGKQNFKTWYIDNTLNYGIVNFNANANIGHWHYSGYRYKHLPDLEDYYKDWNDYDKLDELYENYCQANDSDDDDDDEAWQCPERNLAFKDGNGGKLYNYSLSLAANLHDLFIPFVTYSQTHRTPNIKEVFISNLGDAGVNTRLRPERARTVQLGFNGFKDGILSDDDSLGYKLVGYQTHIRDYIYNYSTSIYSLDSEVSDNRGIIFHDNYQKRVTQKGIELEVHYDAGLFYANLAYAIQRTDQPLNFSDVNTRTKDADISEQIKQGFGLSKVSALPKDYASLDMGVRALEQRFIMGGVLKYFGKSERANFKPNYNTINKHNDYISYTKKLTIARQPLVLDVYLSYEPIKNLVIKGEVQNVLDRKYMDPLDSNNDSASQSVFNLDLGDQDIYVLNNFARGRSYVLRLSYKF